ncbi:hypothetical protein ACFWJ4_16915 [Kitasatospora sp. NPDC127067]|uniref:hypothetical protein n=1 Tax=Kitasatospora sp. NPDC127067 TaxID=3347126 RepID=UPI003651C17F
MRSAGDPLGDAAIAETCALGRQEEVRRTLLGFGRNSGTVPAGLPSRLQQYFEETAVLPSFGYGKAGDTLPPLAELASRLGLLVFKEGSLLTNKGRRREWQVPTGPTDSSA